MVASTPQRLVLFAAEDSPSGLGRTLGKRVGGNPSRVRISYPPPAEGPDRSTVRAFVASGPCRAAGRRAIGSFRDGSGGCFGGDHGGDHGRSRPAEIRSPTFCGDLGHPRLAGIIVTGVSPRPGRGRSLTDLARRWIVGSAVVSAPYGYFCRAGGTAEPVGADASATPTVAATGDRRLHRRAVGTLLVGPPGSLGSPGGTPTPVSGTEITVTPDHSARKKRRR